MKDDVRRFAERVRAERAVAREPGAAEEKEGINTGLLAINPFSGELIPVWVANYVLMEYGTGAVMSVPAHDERDFEFAQKYSLPVRRVIERISHEQPPAERDPRGRRPVGRDERTRSPTTASWSTPATGAASSPRTRCARWPSYAEANGFGEARRHLSPARLGRFAPALLGRAHPRSSTATQCGVVPVPEDRLAGAAAASAPSSPARAQSPLAGVAEFVNTTCPKCGGAARRETDTMDTFVDSSWYFFRYCDPQNDGRAVRQRRWRPTGRRSTNTSAAIEHAVMHLIYTRFWTKFMRDIGLVSFNEPVKRLMTQGMVVAETFYREGEEPGSKVYFNPADVDAVRDDKGRVASATLVSDGLPVAVGAFEKMGKSKNNGVDPNEMITAYGADAARMFVLFAAPVENDLRWQEAGIDGALRFLRRVYSFVHRWRESFGNVPRDAAEAGEFSPEARRLRHETHRTIERVTNDFEGLRYNTAVAAMMELSNVLGDFKAQPGLGPGVRPLRRARDAGGSGADARALRAAPVGGAVGGAGARGRHPRAAARAGPRPTKRWRARTRLR